MHGVRTCHQYVAELSLSRDGVAWMTLEIVQGEQAIFQSCSRHAEHLCSMCTQIFAVAMTCQSSMVFSKLEPCHALQPETCSSRPADIFCCRVRLPEKCILPALVAGWGLLDAFSRNEDATFYCDEQIHVPDLQGWQSYQMLSLLHKLHKLLVGR